MTRGSSVYDFTVTGNEATVEKYLSGKQMQPYVADLSRMETGTMKRPASVKANSFIDWSGLREQVVSHKELQAMSSVPINQPRLTF